MKLLSVLFVFLAAICKAISDTLIHHFGISIFNGKNPNFWDPNVSWNHAKVIFAYKLDAWHIFNSGMILFFTLAIIFSDHMWWITYNNWYKPNMQEPWWIKLINFVGLSILFVSVFNLCYNHILVH